MDMLTLPGSKPNTKSHFEKVDGVWHQRISYLKECTAKQKERIDMALNPAIAAAVKQAESETVSPQ